MDEDRDFYDICSGEESVEPLTLGNDGNPEPAGREVLYQRRERVTYDPRFVEQARKLFKFGITDDELAEFLGVHRATIYKWRAQYPDFAEATQLGKEEADERVKHALFRRAVGYDRRTEKLFADKGVVTRAEVIEHIPPETRAMKFWLQNRCRAEWRESREITGKDGAPLIPDGPASKMEMARYVAFVLQRGALASQEIEDDEDGS